jgi:O-antigen/teichoic acid export membrane protein
MLVLEYGTQSQLGTLQGLDQKVPARVADGDRPGLARLQRAALFNLLVGGALYATLCTVYFARTPGQIRTFWGAAGIALAVSAALLTNLSNFHTSILRSHGRIEVVSAWWMIQGLIGAVLGVGLIPWLGAWGLLWGWLTGTFAATLYVRWMARDITWLAARPDRESLRLLAVGMPMFLYVGLTFVMRSLDRVIILRFLGTEDLGFYSLAVMAIALLLYLPDSVGYVMYPRLLRRFHESGGDPDVLREPLHQVLGAVSIVLPACCAVAYLAADDSVLWLLPKFREGVPALRILCFGAAALGLGNLSALALMVLRRQNLLIPVAVGSVLLGAAAMVGAIYAGFGIRGVAWATLAVYALHSSVMVWLVLGRLHEHAGLRLWTLFRLLAPLGIAIPLAWMCNALLPWAAHGGGPAVLRTAIGMILFLVVYILLVIPFGRGLGLRELAAEFHVPLRLPFRRSQRKEPRP